MVELAWADETMSQDVPCVESPIETRVRSFESVCGQIPTLASLPTWMLEKPSKRLRLKPRSRSQGHQDDQ